MSTTTKTVKPERTLLGYVAQTRRYDGKLGPLLRGKTGKVVLFGIRNDAFYAVPGFDGVIHDKYGPDDDTWMDLYDSWDWNAK